MLINEHTYFWCFGRNLIYNAGIRWRTLTKGTRDALILALLLAAIIIWWWAMIRPHWNYSQNYKLIFPITLICPEDSTQYLHSTNAHSIWIDLKFPVVSYSVLFDSGTTTAINSSSIVQRWSIKSAAIAADLGCHRRCPSLTSMRNDLIGRVKL